MKEAEQQIEDLAEKIAEVEIEADEESVPEEEIEEVTKIPDAITEKPVEVIPKPKAPEEIKPKVEKPKPTPEAKVEKPKVVEEVKPKVEKPKDVEPKVEKPKKKVVPTPKIEPLMPSTESPEEMVSLINIIIIKCFNLSINYQNYTLNDNGQVEGKQACISFQHFICP